MSLAIAGVLVVFLLLVVGFASLARLVASRRGRFVQVILDVEIEQLPAGMWRAKSGACTGLGQTKAQALGTVVVDLGRRISVGVSR